MTHPNRGETEWQNVFPIIYYKQILNHENSAAVAASDFAKTLSVWSLNAWQCIHKESVLAKRRLIKSISFSEIFLFWIHCSMCVPVRVWFVWIYWFFVEFNRRKIPTAGVVYTTGAFKRMIPTRKYATPETCRSSATNIATLHCSEWMPICWMARGKIVCNDRRDNRHDWRLTPDALSPKINTHILTRCSFPINDVWVMSNDPDKLRNSNDAIIDTRYSSLAALHISRQWITIDVQCADDWTAKCKRRIDISISFPELLMMIMI